MKVGFIGLGKMGLPMTKRLLDGGFSVVVKSRSRGPVEQALIWGATEAATPAEMASQVDLLLTCLPYPQTVEEVYTGQDGIFAGARDGLVVADHSTVGPSLSRRMYEEARKVGASFLDAPVSGGPMGAEAGTLSIMVGGDEEAFEKAQPAFAVMGRFVERFGPSGSGSVVKLINNMLVGIHEVALSEALILAERSGINLEQLYQLLTNSTGDSAMLRRSFPFIAKRDFDARFSINLLLKDLGLLMEMAEELGFVPESGALAIREMTLAREQGLGELDVSAVHLQLEKRQST